MPTHHGAETLYQVSQTASAAGSPGTTSYSTSGTLPAPVHNAVTAMQALGMPFTTCFHTTLAGGGTTSFEYVSAVTSAVSPPTYMVVEVTDPSQTVLTFSG